MSDENWFETEEPKIAYEGDVFSASEYEDQETSTKRARCAEGAVEKEHPVIKNRKGLTRKPMRKPAGKKDPRWKVGMLELSKLAKSTEIGMKFGPTGVHADFEKWQAVSEEKFSVKQLQLNIIRLLAEITVWKRFILEPSTMPLQDDTAMAKLVLERKIFYERLFSEDTALQLTVVSNKELIKQGPDIRTASAGVSESTTKALLEKDFVHPTKKDLPDYAAYDSKSQLSSFTVWLNKTKDRSAALKETFPNRRWGLLEILGPLCVQNSDQEKIKRVINETKYAYGTLDEEARERTLTAVVNAFESQEVLYRSTKNYSILPLTVVLGPSKEDHNIYDYLETRFGLCEKKFSKSAEINFHMFKYLAAGIPEFEKVFLTTKKEIPFIDGEAHSPCATVQEFFEMVKETIQKDSSFLSAQACKDHVENLCAELKNLTFKLRQARDGQNNSSSPLNGQNNVSTLLNGQRTQERRKFFWLSSEKWDEDWYVALRRILQDANPDPKDLELLSRKNRCANCGRVGHKKNDCRNSKETIKNKVEEIRPRNSYSSINKNASSPAMQAKVHSMVYEPDTDS